MGADGGDWNVDSNWSPAGVPGGGGRRGVHHADGTTWLKNKVGTILIFR